MAFMPSKSARRAVGRATRTACVAGIEVYGPHAFGFVFFALPAALVAGIAYALFGARTGAGVVGIALSLGIGAVARQSWKEKQLRARREGQE